MSTHKKIIQSSNNTNIYILKLENNKYYVGKSNDLEIRAKAHLNGTASTWTKKYKPISVEQVISNASPYDEDKYTIEYMGKYGIDNVRGGIYVSEALDNTQRNDINKRIWGANDCCTQCGRKGHFVKNCKAITDVTGKNIYEDEYIQIWSCDHCNKEYEDKNECAKHEKSCKTKKPVKTCFQCGETGHYANECPNEEEETFNCRYCDKEFETQKGAIFHENVHCKSKSVGGSKYNSCSRCGREGHNSTKCYARTDNDGYQLDSDDSD
jgi:cellular nucleic acid-binding protein